MSGKGVAECPNCQHEAAFSEFSREGGCPACGVGIQRLHALANERARSTETETESGRAV